jgi:hypothetical protein
MAVIIKSRAWDVHGDLGEGFQAFRWVVAVIILSITAALVFFSLSS